MSMWTRLLCPFLLLGTILSFRPAPKRGLFMGLEPVSPYTEALALKTAIGTALTTTAAGGLPRYDAERQTVGDSDRQGE